MSLDANDTDGPAHVNAEDDESKNIAVIRGQTFESLQILRSLLLLIMPKEDDDGPKLVDLIAALVAQQREILIGLRRLQADINSHFKPLDGRTGGDGQSSSTG